MGRKKTPTATKLLANIKISKDYQQVDNWYKNTKRLLSYVVGDWGMVMYTNKYIVQTMYDLVNQLLPNLYFQNPYIRLKPLKDKFKIPTKEKGQYKVINGFKSAQLAEKALNNELKTIGYEEEVRQIIQDVLCAGFGIMKVGHSNSSSHLEDRSFLDDGDIFAQRVSPFNYGFDPMSTSPDNARYEWYRWTEELSVVKENKDYKHTEDLEGTSISDENPSKKKKEDSKDDSKWVELYEYHDHVDQKIYILTEDSGKKKRMLLEKDMPYKFKGSHFTILKFTGDNDDFRGIAPLLMVEDQSLAINEVFSLNINHLQKFAGVWVYEQGALDDDDLDRFESGEQGDMLQVQAGGLTQGRVKREPVLSSGQEYYQSISLYAGMSDRTLGIPDFARSAQSGKRKTAHEVQTSATDVANRRSYFVSFIKKFIVKTSNKVLNLMQEFYDKERMVLIQGEFTEWVSWNRKDISGEYSFDFDVNELKAYSASQANAIIQAFQMMAPIEFFQPFFKEQDPIKIGTKIWQHLDLDPETTKRGTTLSHIEQDPYSENEYAMNGARVPDPHPSEPHEDHLQIHEQGLLAAADQKDEQAYGELSRHIQMHQYAQQVVATLPGKQQLQQGQPGQQPQQPQQPQGVPSETELQAGITYDDQNKQNLT
jgi:hypothetical protein